MTPMPDQDPQPHDAASELASFGEELRREREIRGISLKEISDATKISKRFLEALERNDHRTLPAPVFTRGFVREYARYVGLSAEEMVNRYNFAAANDERIEKPPVVPKYPQTLPRDISPKPPAKRGIPPAFARVDRNALAAFLIVVALGGVAFWAIQFKRRERETSEAAATVPLTTTKAVTATVAPPPPPAKPDDSMLHLDVEAVGDSWVTLQADDKTVFSDEMKAGDRRTFDANDGFRFKTIGNAAGLALTLNGERVPVLGGEGDVVKNRVFDRDSLARLRSGQQDAQ